ncbi:hypothetical protein H920_00633 [Fukomys damarensis]|uniref:Uncharacterized protein n=1 Tax=Fukomys damarensis TaxID=885580 RepID=A0A091E5L5_FUKDA|nr:hypothetical protein H920_00633 [Fukomys damarensis]
MSTCSLLDDKTYKAGILQHHLGPYGAKWDAVRYPDLSFPGTGPQPCFQEETRPARPAAMETRALSILEGKGEKGDSFGDTPELTLQRQSCHK